MIICEERQLPPNDRRQHDDYAVEATEMAEANPFGPILRSMIAGLLAAMRTRRLGLLRTPSKRRVDCSTRGESTRPPSARNWRQTRSTMPGCGCLRRCGSSDVGLEGGFLLLVAGFDRLAAVVIVKPLRQIAIGSVGASR